MKSKYVLDNWRRNWYFGLYSTGTVADINAFDSTAIILGLEYHMRMRISFGDSEYVDYCMTHKGAIKMPYHDGIDGVRLKKFSGNSFSVMHGKSSGSFVTAILEEDYYNMCIKTICSRFTFTQLSEII
jgi:hypothetical protein